MNIKVLIFIAVVIFVGVSCQRTTQKATTPAKVPTTPKNGATTSKGAKGATSTKKDTGIKKSTTKKGNTKSGATTPSGPKLKAGASTPPVFVSPTPPVAYSCDNITGKAGFVFGDFATGRWFLHREMCAFPFNPWFGICGVGNFTLDATKATSNMVVNTFIEGAYVNSPASRLTPVGTNGILTWNISQVSVRTDVMPSTSTLKVKTNV